MIAVVLHHAVQHRRQPQLAQRHALVLVDEGLDVQIVDFAGGSKSLQAVVPARAATVKASNAPVSRRRIGAELVMWEGVRIRT